MFRKPGKSPASSSAEGRSPRHPLIELILLFRLNDEIVRESFFVE